MKLIFSTFLVLLFHIGFAQEKLSYTIVIESSSSAGQSYKTEVIRKPDLITIRDSKHLAISEKGKKKLIRLFDKKQKHRHLSKSEKDEYNKKFNEIFEKYSSYKNDTLILESTDNNKLEKAIDAIYTTNTHILEWNRTNKDRLVLDGTIHTVSVIKDGNMIKKVCTHSPTKDTYPELYSLISELEAIRLKIKLDESRN